MLHGHEHEKLRKERDEKRKIKLLSKINVNGEVKKKLKKGWIIPCNKRL